MLRHSAACCGMLQHASTVGAWRGLKGLVCTRASLGWRDNGNATASTASTALISLPPRKETRPRTSTFLQDGGCRPMALHVGSSYCSRSAEWGLYKPLGGVRPT